MGTFRSSFVSDLHQHPAISSSAVRVSLDDEDPDRLAEFADKRLPKNWHMELISVANSRDFYVALFYGALGSWPSDHEKRWASLGYPLSDAYERRVPLCGHARASDGKCDMARETAHDLIQSELAVIRRDVATMWSYLPQTVRDSCVYPVQDRRPRSRTVS